MNQVRQIRLWLFLTAFVTGAVVMALEILGSRLLAPVFGNSLFVWGALIGVILAAMSSGYAMGGWLADRYAGGKVLAGLLLCSGIWTLLLAWTGQKVMFEVDGWVQDPRWGPCLAAGILLAPPAFGLSGVLPILLRLAIADLWHLGQHTGQMIAVSTFGSLVGTFGTSFYLLTWLGSMTLVIVLGGIQVFLGLAWLVWSRALGIGATIPVLGLVVLSLWMAFTPLQVLPSPLYQEDSPYQQIRVRDSKDLRFLILDRTYHAVMQLEDPGRLFLPYSQLFVVGLALVDHPREGLILGHGGGSMAKWLGSKWPDLHVDLVEVDPSVVKIAERFFEYNPPPNHHVHVQDARVFLQQTTKSYDIIWVDVFARHLIPFHLTTKEFFSLLKTHLRPQGVAIFNLASSGGGPDQYRAQAVMATLQTVFPVVTSYGVTGPWNSSGSRVQNILFFAGSPLERVNEQEFHSRVLGLALQGKLPGEAFNLLGNHIKIQSKNGLVLTDDFAPFDLLVGREQNPIVPP